MYRFLLVTTIIVLAVCLSGCPDETKTKGPNPEKKTCHQSCQEAYDQCVTSNQDIEACTRDFNACERGCE